MWFLCGLFGLLPLALDETFVYATPTCWFDPTTFCPSYAGLTAGRLQKWSRTWAWSVRLGPDLCHARECTLTARDCGANAGKPRPAVDAAPRRKVRFDLLPRYD